MRGIILAGGTGSRLYPLTQIVNKQLLPVYDVPMIYYPLCTLIKAGIKDICIISSPHFLSSYQSLLGDGSKLGIDITYIKQDEPRGIAQSFVIADRFIGNDQVCLILGDNIFYGDIDFMFYGGAKVFAYRVSNPQDYGVVQFDRRGKAIQIIEKPTEFVSSYAVPGLYIYDHHVVDVAKNLQPSKRGELEITDVNKYYLDKGELFVGKLPKGFVWLDAGTPSALHQASAFAETVQTRQGFKLACVEEVAYKQEFIKLDEFEALVYTLPKSEYKQYLVDLLDTLDKSK